ncbi:hypothetical protein P4J24_13815 [Bacillus anthracis]|nr:MULTISPECIES: hypothetical protein [Bacillus cereus group]MEB9682985.1 hypothetical protein [Bacillus anthracis]
MKNCQQAGIDGILDYQLNQSLPDAYLTINRSMKTVLAIKED